MFWCNHFCRDKAIAVISSRLSIDCISIDCKRGLQRYRERFYGDNAVEELVYN